MARSHLLRSGIPEPDRLPLLWPSSAMASSVRTHFRTVPAAPRAPEGKSKPAVHAVPATKAQELQSDYRKAVGYTIGVLATEIPEIVKASALVEVSGGQLCPSATRSTVLRRNTTTCPRTLTSTRLHTGHCQDSLDGCVWCQRTKWAL
jgi:hypothetical protein